ncbi:MAG: radical SAM protein [Candidatus Omnitrophota bacterium]|jgi:DNA repair photolyase
MIYETNGRAREYFELAANLYKGCEHACRYCYGADVTHTTPDQFFRRGVPKTGALERLKASAARYAKKGERRHVLLSFITDPYQPAEAEYCLTREAIKALHSYGIYVAILTKGGKRSTRDFDILTPLDIYGTSLTISRTVYKSPMGTKRPAGIRTPGSPEAGPCEGNSDIRIM